MLPLFESVFFAFIEQIGFGGTQVDNLGTAVSIFLLNGALFAVVGVRDSGTTANHTPTIEK